MTSALVGVVICEGVLLVLGTGVLMAAGTWEGLGVCGRVGLAAFTGNATFMALVPPLVYLGLSPTPIVVGAVTAVLAAAGVLMTRRRAPADRRPVGRGRWSGVVVALSLVVLLPLSVLKPFSEYDGFLDWTLKARMFYGHGGAVAGALPADFYHDRTYAYANREYPIGLPTLQAFAYHLAGTADARMVHMLSWVIFAAFFACAWALLWRHAHASVLAAGLVVVVVAPQAGSLLLYAWWDIVLACFTVAAALAMGSWLVGDGDDRLVLATVFSAAALGTKEEGLAFTAVLYAAVCVWLAAGRDITRLRRVLVSAAAAAATAVPWQVFNRIHGLRNANIKPSPGRMVGQAGDVPKIVHVLAGLFVSTGWLEIGPLAVVAAGMLLVGHRRPGAGLAYLTLLVLQVGALVLVYWNHAVNLTYLLNTSASRVMTTPMLLSAVALPVLVGSALADGPEAATASADTWAGSDGPAPPAGVPGRPV